MQSADQPVPIQLPGDHSFLCAYDGNIRDDVLAEFVAENIPKDNNGKPKVKDIKILVNCCFGGGLLDDFQNVFGPDGICPGVPWVAGSASSARKMAFGPEDKDIETQKDNNLGSWWTQALAGPKTLNGNVGSIRDRTSDNVKSDLEGIKDKSIYSEYEEPVIGTGNGGENINWISPKTKHIAVVFGGKQNAKRHNNNVKNVTDALKEVWKDEPHEIIALDGSTETTEDKLSEAIENACSKLDENTQLVLYFDDHGGWIRYFGEFWKWTYEHSFDSITPLNECCELPPGWVAGLNAMAIQANDEPMPTLDLTLACPIDSNDWTIQLNNTEISWPASGIIPAGDYQLPINYTTIYPGENYLSIYTSSPTAVITLKDLQLNSGPVNEAECKFFVVDIFESYTNYSPNMVFQTWLDGEGFSPDEFFPQGYEGNGSGSILGHDIWSEDTPFTTIMETNIVRGGSQSMPFYYDNTFFETSFVYRIFDPPSDWSEYDYLSLYIYGNSVNTGGQFFVQINDWKVYPDVDLTNPEWQEVKIDLHLTIIPSELISELIIGVESDSAKGNIYIEDIILYGTEAVE